MADAVTAVAALEQLKALGIHLLMDDFGTGHASLSYLHRLPISTIRTRSIAILWGRSIRTANVWRSYGRSSISVEESVDGLVAEGVENAAQRELLQSLGCEYVQGYLLSPPVDGEAAERLLMVTNRAVETPGEGAELISRSKTRCERIAVSDSSERTANGTDSRPHPDTSARPTVVSPFAHRSAHSYKLTAASF